LKKQPKKTPRAKRERPAPVEVEVRMKKWGAPRESYIERVKASFVRKNTITISINMNVRETEVVEIRPVRRAFDDLAGHLRDAERLANQPV